MPRNQTIQKFVVVKSFLNIHFALNENQLVHQCTHFRFKTELKRKKRKKTLR